jgi:hypothetical protein
MSKESSAPSAPSTSRTWSVFQVLGAPLAVLAIVGVIGMRDSVRDGETFDRDATVFHGDVKTRLTHLERPEAIIQLAQAVDAVSDVEETAKLAAANASAITVVQVEQQYQRADLARNEGYLLQLLEAANVIPKPRSAPRSTGAP